MAVVFCNAFAIAEYEEKTTLEPIIANDNHAIDSILSKTYAISSPIESSDAVVVVVPPEPTYFAANPGAIHIAPLPGHASSVQSIVIGSSLGQ